MLFTSSIIDTIYAIPILLLSFSIHEFSHAYIAYKLGDRSQLLQGRMTLDPMAHLDIFGFIMILVAGFGWGKPVLVDDSNFKKRSRDNMLVSLAGPLSNLIMAVLLTLILKVLIMTNVISVMSNSTIGTVVFNMILIGVQFNIIFAVFNLIPIPPLDGSKILIYFLPYGMKQKMREIERYSFILLMILFVTGIGSYIVVPVARLIHSIIFMIL